MNSVSLFNGMSVFQMAMEDAGIRVGTHYISEIDKYANQATEALFPDSIQLGDVTKWQDWDIDWSSIDLVTGGFPCQAWSIAGKQLGDKDERGMLFWTMLDIMKHAREHNPKVNFIIENVKMKRDFEKYITKHTTEALGDVHKILINSALVSAQNRNRYYWTSFPVIQPEDKGILLADILEFEPEEITIMSGKFTRRNKKILRDDVNGKAKNLSAMEYVKNGRQGDYINVNHGQRTMIKNETLNADGKTHAHLSSYAAGMMVSNSVERKQRSLIPVELTDEVSNQTHNGVKYRKLTPRECMRLQTILEHHIDILLNAGISNTQLYKMTGNAWTMKVISHILKCMSNHINGRVNICNQFTLETDSGYFIARDINGSVYIWDNLIDAHEGLKIMGCDGTKVIFIAEKLLTK